MTKKNAKKQTQRSRGGLAVEIVLLVLVLALLIGGAVAVVFLVRTGDKKLSAEIGGKTYTASATGLMIAPGEEIKVHTDGDYTVAILATADDLDFSFKIGDEPYRWSDLDGREFTRGFTLEKTEDGFRVNYENLSRIVSAVQGTDVVLEPPANGDLFQLVISQNGNELRLRFAVEIPVTALRFGNGGIVM